MNQNHGAHMMLINDKALLVECLCSDLLTPVHSLNTHDGSVSLKCTFDISGLGVDHPSIISGSHICGGGERLILSDCRQPPTGGTFTELYICNTNDSTINKTHRIENHLVFASDGHHAFFAFTLRRSDQRRFIVLNLGEDGSFSEKLSFRTSGFYMTASASRVILGGGGRSQVKMFNSKRGELERSIPLSNTRPHFPPSAVMSHARQELLVSVDGAALTYCL